MANLANLKPNYDGSTKIGKIAQNNAIDDRPEEALHD